MEFAFFFINKSIQDFMAVRQRNRRLESTLEVDSSFPLTHHDSRGLRLTCLVKKRKIHFRILLDLGIQFWITCEWRK